MSALALELEQEPRAPFRRGPSSRPFRPSSRRSAALLGRRYPAVAGHLSPIGFGETRPVAPDDIGGVDTPAGRAQNRRVEMRFSAPPPP